MKHYCYDVSKISKKFSYDYKRDNYLENGYYYYVFSLKKIRRDCKLSDLSRRKDKIFFLCYHIYFIIKMKTNCKMIAQFYNTVGENVTCRRNVYRMICIFLSIRKFSEILGNVKYNALI